MSGIFSKTPLPLYWRRVMPTNNCIFPVDCCLSEPYTSGRCPLQAKIPKRGQVKNCLGCFPKLSQEIDLFFSYIAKKTTANKDIPGMFINRIEILALKREMTMECSGAIFPCIHNIYIPPIANARFSQVVFACSWACWESDAACVCFVVWSLIILPG